METIKNRSFSDIGIILGRSMHHMFRRTNSIITIVLMPAVMMVLFIWFTLTWCIVIVAAGLHFFDDHV